MANDFGTIVTYLVHECEIVNNESFQVSRLRKSFHVL